jgi:hypothetical protein
MQAPKAMRERHLTATPHRLMFQRQLNKGHATQLVLRSVLFERYSVAFRCQGSTTSNGPVARVNTHHRAQAWAPQFGATNSISDQLQRQRDSQTPLPGVRRSGGVGASKGPSAQERALVHWSIAVRGPAAPPLESPFRPPTVPRAQTLDEGVIQHDDDPGGPISFQASHRPEPGLQASVVGLDPIVGALGGVTERERQEFCDCSRANGFRTNPENSRRIRSCLPAHHHRHRPTCR